MIDIIGGLICLAIPIVLIYFSVKAYKKGKKGIYREKFQDVNELLLTNLYNFNPEEFEKGKTEITDSGATVQNYYKDSEFEEAGVFRRLNVKVFEDGSSTNYIFTNTSPNDFHYNNFRRLVNNLYSIYGNDDFGNGVLTADEEDDVFQGHHWSRIWTKTKKEPHLSIYNDEEEGLNMKIWIKGRS